MSDAEVRAIGRATTPNVGFYALVIVLALVAPKVAAFGYLVIAIVVVARTRSGSVSEQPA